MELDDNYEIRGMSIPLNGEYMNINAVKVKNLIVDIPYFDNTHPKANACWYGYDMYGLAFTYSYWYTRRKRDGENEFIFITVKHSGGNRGMSKIKLGDTVIGEDITRKTGYTITHPVYTVKIPKDSEDALTIVAKEIGNAQLIGIKDGNGNALSSTLNPNEYYNDMLINIVFD